MLGMGDLPSGSPDSRNDQPCHEMAVVLWDCCSAPCRVSLGMFGYPKIVIRAGACWRARRAMPNRLGSSRIGAARGRVLTCVRPLMRLTRRRPGWEFADQVQISPTRLKRLMVWTPPDGLCVPEWGC